MKTNRMTIRKTIRREIESLESRRLLAGDVISHWVADDLAADGPIESWVDRVGGVEAGAVGMPIVVSDRFGGRSAVRFDPSDGDDSFRIAPNENPLPTGDFSVAIAFAANKPIAGDTGEWFTNTGLVDANTLGFGTDWGISLAPDGRISVGAGSGFGQQPTTLYSEEMGLHDGELHVVLFTRQAGTLSIYVDDNLSAEVTNASDADRIQRDVAFGILQNSEHPLDGEIAEVRFYNGTLTEDEARAESESIRAYYNNSPPVGVDDTYTLDEDSLLFFVRADAGVLVNDTDAERDALTVELISGTENGFLTLNEDGSFVYTPDANFFGVDTFTYRAYDFRESEITTVTLNVTSVYDPAIGKPETYKILPTETLNVGNESSLLANDLNPDRADLTVELVNGPSSGQLALRPDGTFDYSPNGFTGRTSFSYQINDGTGSSAPVDVTLLVNTAPRAFADEFVTEEDQLLELASETGVLRNDLDAEGDQLTVTLVDAPTNGTLQIAPDGAIVYQPFENFNGEDSFSYWIGDGIDESDPVRSVIRVRPVNDAPIAVADLFFGAIGGELSVDSIDGVLANDFDIDSEDLSAQLVESAMNGSVELSSSGAFVYQPIAGFQGIDSFTYRASDGVATSVVATVDIHVGTTPVRISEFMAANVDTIETSLRDSIDDDFPRDKISPDWIEIENLSTTNFDVGGFYLSDNFDAPKKWRIPSGTILPANGRIIIYASGKDRVDPSLDETNRLHTNFSLNVRGDELLLAFPDGRVAQSFEPTLQYPDVSFGFSADGELGYLITPSPGDSNSSEFAGTVEPIEFSVSRGIYEQSFDLELATATRDAQIRFTTDGTEPTRENGFNYTDPISIATTSTIRAAAFVAGYIPSEIRTSTYLFLADVIQQPESPDGYPTEWARMPGSYGMDPDVVGEANLYNDLYRNTIIEDLKSLPTMSLVFDPDALFASDGIYQNPTGTGDRWERSTSVEFFDPLGKEEGFHVNSGIRVMGGSSRQPDIPKHSFRLEFREQYGWGSLDYPIFENSPYGEDAATSFDELVIRVGFNNSWMHRHYYQGFRGEQPRDQWVRDLQFAMGQPSARGRFVHIYLNGMYWGIYNIQERPAAPHMEQYFGGDKDSEWDVINSNQAIDGSVRSWTQLNRDARNVNDPGEYERLKSRVDVENLADYMLLNFYVGNTDWDGHNWISAARKDGPYRFFAWDSEFAISLPPSNSAIAENAERQIINVNRTTQNSSNNPSGLHRLLLRNDEYQMMFADRVHKHMYNDGALTAENSTQAFLARAAEIDRAVVAESARWGDFRRDVNPGRWRSDQFELFTRNEHFLAQQDFIVNRYLPVRTEIVIDQLRRSNQYPDVAAPVFNHQGGRVPKGFGLSISGTEGTQTYYTLDGTDPRLVGGEVNPEASEYQTAITLSSNTIVKARSLKDGEWSALSEATFLASTPATAANLRISEVHYHPADPSRDELAAGISDGDEFEFIELINISSESIDLSAVRFIQTEINGNTEGIDFQFDAGTTRSLEPNQRIVIVEDVDAFQIRYGGNIEIAGQWVGGLDNGGEQITLFAGEDLIHQFTYDDEWHSNTDGEGYSLESVNPRSSELTDWTIKEGWRASQTVGGSPGTADRKPGDVNGDGIFNSTDLVLVFQHAEYEDDQNGNSTFDEGDWDGDGDFTTRDFVFVFQLGMYQSDAIAVFSGRDQVNQPIIDRLAAQHAKVSDRILAAEEFKSLLAPRLEWLDE